MSDADRAHAEALCVAGSRCLAAGTADAAERLFLDALRLAPDSAEAHANLGILLENRGALDAAEAHYRLSLAIEPRYAQTHSNLGCLLAARRCFAEAEAAHRQAVALAPASAANWSNLGVLLACCHREDEAEHCYRRALACDPAYAKARFNLSYVLLRQGRYAEGWACLEARPWLSACAPADADCPRWQGEPLAGKALLVVQEAGHGDMIQFCRYLPQLKAAGPARLDLVCPPALRDLFASLAGVDALVPPGDKIARRAYDYWVAPLSLPHLCATRLDSIPAPIPYLHASAERLARWAPRLAGDGLRVGLAWKGNPAYENDADRSLPSLDLLAPLASVAGVRFISLQKGAGEDEARRAPAALPLLHLGAEIADFADSAAIVAQLDLIVSVDTALAHLAGALGRPCWVMLPDYKTDWRWLVDRSDSPWYPRQLRLFRQRGTGGWPPVVEEIRSALVALAR